MPNTITYEVVDNIILAVIGVHTPNDAEWDAYLEFCAQQLRSGVRHALVVAVTGAPSPVQRKKLTELTARVGAKRAVLTSSPMTRGAVTAMSWYNPLHRTFSPKDLAGALAFLGVVADETRVEWFAQRIADARKRVL